MFLFFHKNRRRQRRQACQIRGWMLFACGLRAGGTVMDLSHGGCRFRLAQAGVFATSRCATLLLPNARVGCFIRRRQGGQLHCSFDHALAPSMLASWIPSHDADTLSRRLALARLRFGLGPL